MNILGIFFIFLTIILLLGLRTYQTSRSVIPIARPSISATWKMNPGYEEGFADKRTLEEWLPSPEVLTKQSVGDCPSNLGNADTYTGSIKTSYKSFDLLNDWIQGKPEPRVASGPTSQECYTMDWARGLERAGSYAQRTNNYRHGYPDSCSAPNHDLILDFYKEKPQDPPYQV